MALAATGLRAQPAAPVDSAPLPLYQFEAALTHDDNVTRGRSAGEIRSDQSLSVRLSRDWSMLVNPSTRVILTGVGGGEAWRRHSRLGRGFVEAQGMLEYRGSGAFSAPTFAAFARVSGEAYRSTLRSGHRYALGGIVSAALTDRIFALASVSHEGHVARSDVFSGRSNAARLNLDYALTDRATLYASAEYRRGDATASGRISLENIDISKSFVDDDAFSAAALKTYRFEAETVIAVIGCNVGLGPNSSIDLSWRRAETRPTTGLPFASDVPGRYVANQFVIAVLRRF